MNLNIKHWQKLFLFCAGLFIAATFCMKWMEGDLQANGKKFTIMGLELFYTRETVMSILAGLDDRVRTILGYHLHFDFVFMAAVFPGVAALCMIARAKATGSVRRLFFILAVLQLAAWSADIYENLSLLTWMNGPIAGNEFARYHFIVASKWIIVVAGALVSVTGLLFFRKKN